MIFDDLLALVGLNRFLAAMVVVMAGMIVVGLKIPYKSKASRETEV